MAGEEGDIIEWTVRGALEAGKWSLEQLRDWLGKRGVVGATEKPETMIEIPASGAIDPNWYLQLIASRDDPRAYRLAITKTADAVAANVRLRSVGYFDVQFIGNTEWPGEVASMTPLLFVILDPGIFGEFVPEIEISWDGVDGVRRDHTVQLPSRWGMIG